MKLNIELLPKGAWNNDFSKTLPQNDWDNLREYCYQNAGYKCEICGLKTAKLDAHEVWDFDIIHKSQTLTNIVALCTKCHMVKHFKNTVRLGFGKQAKDHFIKVNNCSEMDFSNHLLNETIKYEKLNKVYRWKIHADLSKFGGKNIKLLRKEIPMIDNPYENIRWNERNHIENKKLFNVVKQQVLLCAPKVISIEVDNYQGLIIVNSLFTDRIEWYLDDVKIKTKYNTVGRLCNKFSVKGLTGKFLYFKLINKQGEITSQLFKLNKVD